MAPAPRWKVLAAAALLAAAVVALARVRAPPPPVEYAKKGYRVLGGPSRPLLVPDKKEDQMSEGGQEVVLWEQLFRNDSQQGRGFFVEFGARGGVLRRSRHQLR